jgi:multicomponent Na+:H+ antiporter subunit B
MQNTDSIILRAVVAFLFFLINVFAIYLLLRGHNLPGGGFIGGLGSALSFILLCLAFGVERTQQVLRVDPLRIAIGGMVLALATAVLPLFWGGEFLEHVHLEFDAVMLGHISVGTPLFFDVGVFLVVVGVVTKLIFVLVRSITGLVALQAHEHRRYASELESPIEKTGARVDAPKGGRS